MNIQPEIRDLFDPNSAWGAILYAAVFGTAAVVAHACSASPLNAYLSAARGTWSNARPQAF